LAWIKNGCLLFAKNSHFFREIEECWSERYNASPEMTDIDIGYLFGVWNDFTLNFELSLKVKFNFFNFYFLFYPDPKNLSLIFYRIFKKNLPIKI
jgi:hypothetical protein